MSAVGLASAIFGTWCEVSADGAFAIGRATGTIIGANVRFADMPGHDASALRGTSLHTLSLHTLLRDQEEAEAILSAFGHRPHLAFLRRGEGLAYISLEIAAVSHLGRGELVACQLEQKVPASQLNAERGGPPRIELRPLRDPQANKDPS